MAKVKAEFAELETLVTDFDRSVEDYKMAIDSFFNEINQFEGWKGEAADKYLKATDKESTIYKTVGEALQNYGNTFSDTVDMVESTVSQAATK